MMEEREKNAMRCVPEGALDKISSFEWMLHANRNARKRKRYRGDVLRFTEKLERNVLELQKEMRDGTYRTGKYRRIWVSIPKRRLVMALPYRDRIVQWCIYLLLNPYFDRRFIEDSYACRIGKGSHKAVQRLQYWLRKTDRKQGPGWYYLKLDISKYFYRVNHDVLMEILGRHIKDERLMNLIDKIINNPNEPFGLPPGKGPEDVEPEEWLYDVGMPIGNLSSQLFANIVLNELDQHAKHKMKVRYYIRYMDDAILLAQDKKTLHRWKEEIQAFLRDRLKLELNRKTAIRPVRMGIEFVGVRVWSTHILLRKRTTRRLMRETKAIAEKRARGEMSEEDFARRVVSMRGVLDHACTGALRWKLDKAVTEMERRRKEDNESLS